MKEQNKKVKDQNDVGGFLKGVEVVGNKLPHPAIIFAILSVIVIIVSYFAAKSGMSVTYFDAKAGEEVTKEAVSLLNWDGLRYIFNSATDNYTGFAPLGTVLVAMLGVGVAENSGLFDSTLKKLLSNVNPTVLSATVVFAGVMSNIASDAGYLVVVPLGALIFANAGRHPLAGIAAAFAGVSGGFSANLILGTTDPLLTNITNEALRAGGIDMELAATCNWYFLFVSTFLITIVGTLVTNKIVEKNLGEYHGTYQVDENPLTELEIKGLRNALIALIIFVAIMAFLMFPAGAPFRELEEGKNAMTLKHFLGHGLILAKNGADFLESIGLNGLPLLLMFILLSAFLNLFMGSASAKWAIMAPIFVPMMYNLGLSPALTQVAYRIGDSSTNIITPLMSYFAMIVVFMQKYDKDSGLGTLTSMMLPYSMCFLVGWSLLMIVWYLVGLPVGPEAPLHVQDMVSMLFI